MRKAYHATFIVLIPFFCFSQHPSQKFRPKGWQTFVYQVNSAESEQFAKWDSIPVNSFINRTPLVIFNADSVEEEKLPIGNYVLVTAKGIDIEARLICRSNLAALTINNKNKLQLDVRDKSGEFIPDAKIFVNGNKALYNAASSTFWVNKTKLEDAFVKIYAPADTLFLYLTEKDDYSIRPIAEQRRQNYRRTKIYTYLNWLPSKIRRLFTNGHRRPKSAGTNGFIVFNQPKYKPLDTVKFKGYIINKHGHRYKKDIEVHLSYYSKGRNFNQVINTIPPVTPGAFTGQFILADTIPSDINCRLIFTTPGQKYLLQNQFHVEDYVLDEIGTYSFSSEKTTYFKKDSLRFFASAKDANGLNVLDAKATLLLTTGDIKEYYQDTLFVKDTIYDKEIPLATNGDTKFAVAAAELPKAGLTIHASLTFKNSNNELHEESTTIAYTYLSRQILVTQKDDSVKAVYVEDGVEKAAAGEMAVNDEAERPVVFPLTLKIDPLAKEYSFYVSDKTDTALVSEYFDVEKDYRLNFSRISSGDTLGFLLNNPYKIPVYYTVFNGNHVVATGKESTASIIWEKQMGSPRRLYRVRWEYIWAGEEQQGEETIGLLYKLLNIKIRSNPSVYPGQKDSIRVEVRDYLGKPAPAVNLTAVSYNNQFNREIKLQEPPYLANYKSKKLLMRPGYESYNENLLLTKNYRLGKNTLWINQFHLDTMAYYRLLFLKDGYADEITPISGFVPQVSVNVVRQGVPQEIYLLYINRQLVYYNGVTDRMSYAFEVYPENVQIGIRLKDTFIEIDSLYMQPNYKHDLSFDLDNLPPHSRVTAAGKSWSADEIKLLEESMWQMQNDYQNNNAYLWQENKVVRLSGNREHIAGPFYQGKMTFFNPGAFDITFNFEPGYRSSLSKQVIRLEKNLLFPKNNLQVKLPEIKETALVLGDTVIPAPPVLYPVPQERIDLPFSKEDVPGLYGNNKIGRGSLQFNKPKDSLFSYFILEPSDTFNRRIIINGSAAQKINNIRPGSYSLLLVTSRYYVALAGNLVIKEGGTTCVKADALHFSADNALFKRIVSEETGYQKPIPVIPQKSNEKTSPVQNRITYNPLGNSSVAGTVTDKKGKSPVPGAMLRVKGYEGVMTDASGNFNLNGLMPGKYAIVISAVGYVSQEIAVSVGTHENITLNILLNASVNSLQEVVVTGYGAQKRRELTGSMVVVRGESLGLQTALQGRAPGINILNFDGYPGSDAKISLRGITSEKNNPPLYVIDGILYDKLPANLDESNIGDIAVLKDAPAMAIYGARAANGAVIITTKTKTFRKQFHDYALWQPNFFTDKNGSASIEINYPDNITGWKTFVVGIDRKRRAGKASVLTQSYKPLVAELSLPQFLTDGDSANIIGKSKNYTADTYLVTNEFVVDEKVISSQQKQLLSGEAGIGSLKITNHSDTVKALYTLQSNTGFKDAEERSIPVFKKGSEEAIGNFWMLQNDTTVSFTAMPGVNELNIYAQNNTLDMMLEELDHLRRYPYYCMEQIASKLTGLALEKKIKEKLKLPFTGQREFDRLLQKIEKAQLFDGGWAWWENGKTNFYITNYITNALLQFRGNVLVETNVRNAFLYLQNQLPFLKTNDLLSALFTLSNGKHEMEYTRWINKINFDSLSQHQQWEWIRIRQQQKMSYQSELKKLVAMGVRTMPGGMHWGLENYSWHSNEIASTVLAYKVLEDEPVYSGLGSSIIQYFLEKKHNGYWNNTVESATILNAILPGILARQNNFTNPATLTITGDTSILINNFPYQVQANTNSIKNISIQKSGGGLLYLTAYQNIFNSDPQPVEDKFIIHTYFERNNGPVTTIKAGEITKMILNVTALKDAEYVEVEIPIPAGCNYASKSNNDWKVYKEFYKNKVMLFIESLSKGIHKFEITLEPRYSGTYTLNPAKVSLMYYPIFYGRNGMRKINIEN